MDVCLLAAQAVADCLSSAPSTDRISVSRGIEIASQPLTTGTEPTPSTRPQPGLDPHPQVMFTPAATCLESIRPGKPVDSCLPPAPAPDRTNPDLAKRPQPTGATNVGGMPLGRSEASPHQPGSNLAASPVGPGMPQFSPAALPALSPDRYQGRRPTSGAQLYYQRLVALQAGHQYTRISPDRYADRWQSPESNPSYQQWQQLLAREASVMAAAQGRNRLTILVGDSLTLWLPPEQLPRDRFWLNQSISGETTDQMRQRIPYFAQTRPDTIDVMAGINDLKQGASDREVVNHIRLLLVQLRQQHPQAAIKIYSILPTRLPNLPSDRIRQLNQYIAYVARQQGVEFIDLQPDFTDAQGLLRRDLTTDGLHLSPRGYQVWEAAFLGR